MSNIKLQWIILAIHHPPNLKVTVTLEDKNYSRRACLKSRPKKCYKGSVNSFDIYRPNWWRNVLTQIQVKREFWENWLLIFFHWYFEVFFHTFTWYHLVNKFLALKLCQSCRECSEDYFEHSQVSVGLVSPEIFALFWS